ncbi:MAG TPA: FGGY family carbohydrate kinase, partial [Actinomycetota bacterium]|nr:FGGY family carbohydrate kinase [Actinomycetota bacterium]
MTALLVDEDGVPTRKAYREFPSYFPQPGWVEQDPDEIWRTVVETVAEVTAGTAPSDIAAVGITNQRETTVLWERSTLNPVHRAIVWQCRRSAPICEELRERGVESEIRRRTGLLLDPYFSGTKLTWLFRNNPEFATRAAKGELAFGTIDSWLIARLTDGALHATDPSNASRTLLYNLAEARWDPYLLELMEVPEAVLPKVEPSSHRFGGCTLPSLAGVPIGGVAGDQQSALFGQACFTKGMAKNTYGTGSFILTNAGAEAPVSTHGLLTSVAWEIESRIEYALEGSVFITGAGIQWLRDGLGIIGSSAEAGPLASSVEDSAGVYFVPALTGLGAP